MYGNSHPLATLRETFLDAVQVSLDFFKVLVPIIIGMKILTELDWIRYLALPLEPVMHLTGLPADLGIAWATGIMVNFYSALIVFVGLLPGLPPLTTEQTTTLAVMMLIAHSIPAEGRVAAQCGVSLRFPRAAPYAEAPGTTPEPYAPRGAVLRGRTGGAREKPAFRRDAPGDGGTAHRRATDCARRPERVC